MLIYNNVDGSKSMWNKDTLIALRAFEDRIKAFDDWKYICLAKPVEG